MPHTWRIGGNLSYFFLCCVMQVVQVLTEDPTDMRRSETFSRLMSKSHDFAYSDTESQEDYGYTDDYENDMQRHRALALEFE